MFYKLIGVIVVLFILSVYLHHEAYGTRVYWFHRPGCPACEAMKKEWDLVESGTWFGMVKAIAVDTSKSENDAIASNFNITTVPAIFKIENDIRTMYDGNRSAADILEWAKKVETGV